MKVKMKIVQTILYNTAGATTCGATLGPLPVLPLPGTGEAFCLVPGGLRAHSLARGYACGAKD